MKEHPHWLVVLSTTDFSLKYLCVVFDLWESSNASKLLQDYTQVILDITFYEENKLVDQEFPEDCSAFKIQQLLEDLTDPEVLKFLSVLGQELLECLYWRRGALRYMYCHTLHQRKHWIKKIYML
uniref:Uncharacterized protein n=1 Tax=Amphiprion percula TaxID=161767 RepID=A0A3P8TV87_AMPPE